MSYKNPQLGTMPPVFLNSFTRGLGGRLNPFSAPVSGGIGLSNRMIYVPFELRQGVTVYRHYWLNGGTASTNNVNVAVYTSAFSRLAIGTATLATGANVCQFDDVTDYQLTPGRYYMALWANGNTTTFLRTASTSVSGVYYETNASGPQATGTPAAPGTSAPLVPVFGLALRATDP